MKSLAIHRPGALGDVMMILNCIPRLRKHFDKIDLFCHKSTFEKIGNFCNHCGLLDGAYDYMVDFDHRKYDKIVSPIGYPQFEGYPDVPMKKHLIEYFARELGVEEDVSFDDVFLTPLRASPEIDKPLYITIQNKTGWSMYKEWWGWQQLIDKLKTERPDVGIYQIGGSKDPELSNIDGSLLGHSFEENLAAQIWSKLHVGLDSVFNHTSNYSWHGIGKKSCVILFGSTQYDASGYKHNTNISLNLPCQPCFREDPTISGRHRGVCPNPSGQTWENPKHECMAGISVDRVYNEVMKLL